MIFNFTNNYKLTTRLTLNDTNIEVIEKTKLLGTIITNDLKWQENTKFLTKKGNMRLEILRKAAAFNASLEDLKIIYTTFIRSLLEQSCVVWQSGLTEYQKEDLERIQKTALKIIFKLTF